MDTSAARRAIFDRIRTAQGRPAQPEQAEHDAVSAYLTEHPAGPRPTIGPDVCTHFQQQALRMLDTVALVPTFEDVPGAVAQYLDELQLSRDAVAWATLDGLPWQAAGIQVAYRRPVDADMVGITGSFCAVAETGTLMLLSGEKTWPSASLLPETHIAVVAQSRIVPTMEDAFALARAERGELPRAVNFISGPSRTADIEQIIVMGAHGPYRVHVIIVQQA